MEQRILRDYTMPNLDAVLGSLNEDPNQYIKRFLTICHAFKYNGVSDDAIHLRLFTLSLIDDAFMWLDLEPIANSWDELASKFLVKYFPSTKRIKLRIDIINF
ncbi:oligopeptide transporter 4-like [Gossypium australe]|uniref:Oligopeptide transporter 4-like n=1 Tax=Gossypium australe TaxID=47621 RepID=A0A5B6VMB4_9ROSI|nr:oligopeptide transporter 4-like [Gossypium australe]